MSNRNYMQIVAATVLFALAAFTWVVPGALSAQQNVNNSNTKASKTKTVTASRSLPPLKRVRTAQQPPKLSVNVSAVKKSTKISEVEKEVYTKMPQPPHQYQLLFHTDKPGVVRVNVTNIGKGAAKAGSVKIEAVAWKTAGGFPPEKIEGTICVNDKGYITSIQGSTELPPLKAGEWVTVEAMFDYTGILFPCSTGFHGQDKAGEFTGGVLVSVTNNMKMEDGQLSVWSIQPFSKNFFNY